MMASPNFAYQIYDGDGSTYNMTGPAGSAEAEREFKHYFRDIAHQNFTSIEFSGRSDYGPFLGAGIAAGGIATGAEAIKTLQEEGMFGGHSGLAFDPNYHSRYDNVYNLNVEAWEEMTKAIAHMTATYARSWDSFPKKSRSKREFDIKDGVTDKAAGRTWGI
jgi:Zn-dependent M28 family amino/carboxypeptidase